MRRRLTEIVYGKEFRDTLIRFIPADVQSRTLGREGFLEHLVRTVDGLLMEAGDLLNGKEFPSTFD